MGEKRPNHPGNQTSNNIMKGMVKSLKDGDNSRIVDFAMKLRKFPKIDITNYEQVEQRINDFFQLHIENDVKPTVNGLALALGVDRRRLWEYQSNGDRSDRGVPDSVRDLIRYTYTTMTQLWEIYLQEGKINPVSGIFLGKNHFGYSDGSDMQPQNVRVDVVHHSLQDIQSKYLPQSIRGELSEPAEKDVIEVDDFQED